MFLTMLVVFFDLHTVALVIIPQIELARMVTRICLPRNYLYRAILQANSRFPANKIACSQLSNSNC